jgi:hypothetical protein
MKIYNYKQQAFTIIINHTLNKAKMKIETILMQPH